MRKTIATFAVAAALTALGGVLGTSTVALADLTCREGDQLIDLSTVSEEGRTRRVFAADHDDDGFVCRHPGTSSGPRIVTQLSRFYDDI